MADETEKLNKLAIQTEEETFEITARRAKQSEVGSSVPNEMRLCQSHVSTSKHGKQHDFSEDIRAKKSEDSSLMTNEMSLCQPDATTSENGKWHNVPQAIMGHNVLCRLPLADCIRFAAVCKSWESTQREYFAPPAVPILTLPWLFPIKTENGSEEISLCFSKFEDRFYRLRLPDACGKQYLASAHGHNLLFERTTFTNSCVSHYVFDWKYVHFYLQNPITKAIIKFPRVYMFRTPTLGVISSRPSDPNCVILVASDDEICLCHVRVMQWSTSDTFMPKRVDSRPKNSIRSAIFFHGKFYCFTTDRYFFIVDPLADPYLQMVQMVQMDDSQLPPESFIEILVEFNNEISLVVLLHEFYEDPALARTGFQVFKADLSERIWLKLGSFGDKVLLLSNGSCFYLLGAEIGSEGNRIIMPTIRTLEIFDLGTGRMIIQALPVSAEHDTSRLWMSGLHWMVPSLLN